MNNIKKMFSSLIKKEGTKSVVSSLIAIGFGLIFGVIIIFIANPNDVFDGFRLLLTGGFYK